jgi:hypothetical protein
MEIVEILVFAVIRRINYNKGRAARTESLLFAQLFALEFDGFRALTINFQLELLACRRLQCLWRKNTVIADQPECGQVFRNKGLAICDCEASYEDGIEHFFS